MNRIDQLFQTKSRDILSVFFTAGYPNRDTTVEILHELEAAGVDMVEIGIPFSDPMADGPVIQASSTVALAGGMSLRLLFEQIGDIRSTVRIPLVMMGYLNPIIQYGFDNFCRSCQRVGVDGVIIPDLPMADYLAEYKAIAESYGLKVVMLVTPETSPERIRAIDSATGGFLYVVSSAATTGAQSSFEGRVGYFKRLADMSLHNPRMIGFGISNRQTYSTACDYASGGIIGSKFIELLGSKPTVKDAVRSLVEAVR